MEEVTVRVRCNGQLHRVRLAKKKLGFLDHPSIQREMTLFEFGDHNVCGCARLLHHWRKSESAGLPPQLRGPCRQRLVEKLQQLPKIVSAPQLPAQFLYHLPCRVRRENWIRTLLYESLRSCNYPFLKLHFDVGVCLGYPAVRVDTYTGGQTDRWGKVGIERVTVTFYMPTTWLVRVWARGAELVTIADEKFLVLWCEKSVEGGTTLTYVRRSSGYQLKLSKLHLPDEEFDD